MNIRLDCAVCGSSWATARGRASHELRGHPDWSASTELRRQRTRARIDVWVDKQPPQWRWVGWTNANARRIGHAPIPRNADWPTGPCAYCGGPSAGWDHVVPLSRGGSHTLDNLVPCCWPCNRRKNVGTPERAMVPSSVTLLCAWCWKPLTRRSADVRRYVACREHINKIRRNPLPFGLPAFCRRERRFDGANGYRIRAAQRVTTGVQDGLALS